MMIANYVKSLSDVAAQGDAREESYYGDLSKFFKDFSGSIGKKAIQITTLPKKTDAGNPDFRIWDGQQHIVGYVEAKKPGENLDVIERSEQLKRYRDVFPNLILTDFYEFRLYRNGELVDKVLAARPFIAKKLKTTPPVENEEKLNHLLQKFFDFSLPRVFSAEALAQELAKRTRFLRDQVIARELEEEEAGKGSIYGFYVAFKKYLIADLKEESFADIYSQTITYGMFAARTRANGTFTRRSAFDLIPPTIGILRDVFRYISLDRLPMQMEVTIDDIASVLQAADVSNILHEYYRKGKGEDPIVHFYETFLNIYDPATREKRGVYYTPEPVVKYIVRALHDLLKSHFDLADGLASNEVTLLDPAGGTLTFPAEAIKLATEEYVSKYGDGGLDQFFRNHILKHYYAFELMMAPYAIGHIKISFLLEELGYKMQENDRFNLFLTNTLDMEDLEQIEIPGLGSLSEESHKAGQVKKNEPILVILGNPPYSGHSATKNDWTEKLLKENIDGAQSYYEVDGKPLGEKNPKWLQDDYVKFLRFAQWKIHKAGKGIVGMITNHSYLDNPTFRGMRQSLLKTFNQIYVLDLHGNSLKKESAPDGSKDVNVFDIQQGVAIVLLVKEQDQKGCKVYVNDLYGTRDAKYTWLNKKSFSRKNYDVEKPVPPFYFLKKTNTIGIENYLAWHGVAVIFPVNSVGIVTARDSLTIKWSATEVLNTVRSFSKMEPEIARQAYQLGKDARDWQVELAQKDLLSSGLSPENIFTIQYRPFDYRFTFYTGTSRGFHCMPRPEVMQHMLKENVGLIARRQQLPGRECNYVFISDILISDGVIRSDNKGGESLFPLYLYKSSKPSRQSHTMMLFEPELKYDSKGRIPNISKVISEKLEKAYKKKFESKDLTPEHILYYCYAILYSNTYREKFAEFLRIDFPRIPFTTNYKLFTDMASLGEALSDLHLLKHKALNKPIAKYKGKGDNRVEKIKYDEEKNVVFINTHNYFEGIAPELWNYHIGGYQVLEKYLKDRKGRIMEDPVHYCRIATALNETIRLQSEIDTMFDKVEASAM